MYQFQDEIIVFLPLNLKLQVPQQQHYCSTNRSQQQKHSEYELVDKEEKSNKLCLIETVIFWESYVSQNIPWNLLKKCRFFWIYLQPRFWLRKSVVKARNLNFEHAPQVILMPSLHFEIILPEIRGINLSALI